MENVRDKDLLFICFDSLGAAYEAAQAAAEGIEIMEIFPLGNKGHVVFFAEESLRSLQDDLQKKFGESLLNSKLIEKCSAQVLKAYFSVENAILEQSFMVCESYFIGDLAAVANDGVKSDLRIVDLRLLRGSAATATLFLTGSDEGIQAFAKKLQALPVKVTVISKPSAKIRDFFAIQP